MLVPLNCCKDWVGNFVWRSSSETSVILGSKVSIVATIVLKRGRLLTDPCYWTGLTFAAGAGGTACCEAGLAFVTGLGGTIAAVFAATGTGVLLFQGRTLCHALDEAVKRPTVLLEVAIDLVRVTDMLDIF